MRSLLMSVVLAAAGLFSPAEAPAQDPTLRFGETIPAELQALYERGLGWLANAQTDSGSWTGSHQGSGLDGICLMAFLASGEDPNFGKYAANVRRALRALLSSQNGETGYLPNSMYHHGFGMLALSEAYGCVDESLLWEGKKPVRSIAQALELAIRCSVTSQKKNRYGGWRYSPDATDADTSVVGAMLMGLFAARNAGMEVPDECIQSALEYMRRSTGKDGSVAYSGGFGGLGGSLNLTAIATLLGAVSKSKETNEYKAALGRLRENLEHKEPNYAEYFGYYAAQALFQSDYAAWQKWNTAKIRALHSAQRSDGSFSGGAYETGMSLLALALNYRFLPIYER